jgi:hypothetical protein
MEASYLTARSSKTFIDAHFVILWRLYSEKNPGSWWTIRTLAEFAPYVAVAEAYDYQVEILTFACSVETAQARKQLVAEWKVRQKFKELHEETVRFPRYLAEIHRVIPCE